MKGRFSHHAIGSVKRSNSTHLNIVLVHFADLTKKVNWVWVAHVPLERLDDVLLCLKDLAFCVRRVSAVKNVDHTLAARNMHAIPTNCSLAKETTCAERKWSIMFTAK